LKTIFPTNHLTGAKKRVFPTKYLAETNKENQTTTNYNANNLNDTYT